MIDFPKVIEILNREKVDFVLIGGAAMKLHGSAYVTQDVDICYGRSRDNIQRLVNALRPCGPFIRSCAVRWRAFRSNSTKKLSSGV